MLCGMIAVLAVHLTPVLAHDGPPYAIITDEAAFSIDTEQSLALHRALWKRRVPGEVIVTRAGDVAASREQIRRTTEWFRRWLKP